MNFYFQTHKELHMNIARNILDLGVGTGVLIGVGAGAAAIGVGVAAISAPPVVAGVALGAACAVPTIILTKTTSLFVDFLQKKFDHPVPSEQHWIHKGFWVRCKHCYRRRRSGRNRLPPSARPHCYFSSNNYWYGRTSSGHYHCRLLCLWPNHPSRLQQDRFSLYREKNRCNVLGSTWSVYP